MTDNKLDTHALQRRQLPDITFRYRLVGMGLGGLPIAAVLVENASGLPYWLWLIGSCYVWPWLALLWAKNSKDPFATERRNLTLDSFIAGTWVSLLHFNLLPSMMLLVITSADKISTGIKHLWLYSLPFILAGIALGGLLTGFAFQPETSMAVILATLPIMSLHTLAVSYGTSRLVRKVSKQNRKLTVLSQTDFLTGMFNRGQWQKLATQCLEARQKSPDTNASNLILVDVDKFKAINDTYGHSVGDDVLKAIAKAITTNAGPKSLQARLGGDEFAIIVPLGLAKAKDVAKAIRTAVKAIRLAGHSELRCSVSTGVAENSVLHRSLRQWFDQADQDLYRQKVRKKQALTP